MVTECHHPKNMSPKRFEGFTNTIDALDTVSPSLSPSNPQSVAPCGFRMVTPMVTLFRERSMK